MLLRTCLLLGTGTLLRPRALRSLHVARTGRAGPSGLRTLLRTRRPLNRDERPDGWALLPDQCRGDLVERQDGRVEQRGDPVERRDDPVESGTIRTERRGDPVQRRGDPVERRGDPVGRRGDPVERRGNSVGRRGDTVERRGDSVGRRGDSVGRRGNQVQRRDDPVERPVDQDDQDARRRAGDRWVDRVAGASRRVG